MEHLPDRDLLTSSNEDAAFKAIYERYWEQLYIKAFRRLGNDADAQDCVQEVFISCWRNRHSIELQDTLAPYLFTGLKYSIIKKLYRSAKNNLTVPLSIEVLAQTTLSSEEFLEYKDLQGLIAEEVNKLPEKMQLIYKLSRNQQLSIAEISEKLNISQQTVKNTLTTALQRLKGKFSAYSCLLLFFL